MNAKKIKYMLLPHHQNIGQNHNMRTANKDFENVTQFKYFGKTVKIPNFIQGEIKSILSSGNACYHSVQNLLSLRLLS
jgi:exopolysaccharide biosynthesis predicted pyruvyltransferase EpsI